MNSQRGERISGKADRFTFTGAEDVIPIPSMPYSFQLESRTGNPLISFLPEVAPQALTWAPRGSAHITVTRRGLQLRSDSMSEVINILGEFRAGVHFTVKDDPTLIAPGLKTTCTHGIYPPSSCPLSH